MVTRRVSELKQFCPVGEAERCPRDFKGIARFPRLAPPPRRGFFMRRCYNARMNDRPKPSVLEWMAVPLFIVFCALIAVGIARENQLWFVLAIAPSIPLLVVIVRSASQVSPKEFTRTEERTYLLRIFGLSAFAFAGFAAYGACGGMPRSDTLMAAAFASLCLGGALLAWKYWKVLP